MDIRRIILAVILMAAVLVVTPMLFPPPEAPEPAPSADTLSLRGDTARAVTDRLPTTPQPDTTRPDPRRQPSLGAVGDVETPDDTTQVVAIDTTVVETNAAHFRTTNMGAALIGAQMTQYRSLTENGRARGELVELAAPGDRLIGWRLVVPGDTIHFNRAAFQQTRENGERTTVRYDATIAGRAIAVTYSFLPDSYRVNIAVQVTGSTENAYLLVDMPPTLRSSEADSSDDRSHLSYAYKPDGTGAKGVGFGSLDPGERRVEPGPHTWVVAKNKYFILGLLTPEGQRGFEELIVVGGVRETKQATRAQATVVVPVRDGGAVFELYAGPQEFKRMAAMGREFEQSNPYGGWLQGVVQPFAVMVIRLLLWMKQSLDLSYGWILIIFGIAVRIILWPINQRAMRTSIQMQRIQPELQAIQQKHKGDPQRLHQEMMKVYKEHNMSPFSAFSGCLPMLIPLPVFFALFFVFQNTIEFRGVPFLWFPDISQKDPFYVVPILVAMTAMLMSWIGMRGIKANDQQKIMMYMMPAVMLIVFLNLAAGLNLYYLVQNLASLPQQWLIARERAKVPVKT